MNLASFLKSGIDSTIEKILIEVTFFSCDRYVHAQISFIVVSLIHEPSVKLRYYSKHMA